jgi:cell division septal protein FtsQ
MGKSRRVLRNQRPKKRRRRLPIKPFIYLFAASLAALGLWYSSHFISEFQFRATERTPLQWRINVLGEQLSSAQLSDLHRVITNKAPYGAPAELDQAARTLQAKLAMERVRIVRTGSDQLAIFIKARRAFLRVFTGKERLLSEVGQIYGTATEADQQLPLLKGLPMDDVSWGSDGTLEVSAEVEQLIQQAILLTKECHKYRFAIDTLEYIPYRGYQVTRAQDQIQIIVGFEPFDDKLARLTNLIDSLKKKSSHVERIELDYQGKAFIKQKKS